MKTCHMTFSLSMLQKIKRFFRGCNNGPGYYLEMTLSCWLQIQNPFFKQHYLDIHLHKLDLF